MNKIERRSHQTKGGMCMSCKKSKEDCSDSGEFIPPSWD
jgi:hypothetical protein